MPLGTRADSAAAFTRHSLFADQIGEGLEGGFPFVTVLSFAAVLDRHAQITLRFRIDEKRFNVDGASGVCFELLKKRLDKARVSGTDERITQPNTVALV